MRIFLHTANDAHKAWADWEAGVAPGHFLYGATHLKEYGIDVVLRKFRRHKSSIMRSLDGAWQILFCKEKIDAVFATYHNGIALIVMLRALHLYRKPVIVWHHQPVIHSRKWWREWLGRFYYRGMDAIIFFSEELRAQSLSTGKIRPDQAHVCHWGADLDFYDRLKKSSTGASFGFISTGKELRDMATLVAAFNQVGAPLDIHISRKTGGMDYAALFASLEVKENIHVHFLDGANPNTLSAKVAQAGCVVICCQKTDYTVGLTTVVEALALGKPIICTRNTTIPIDFEAASCGISVDYYDVEGWVAAVKRIIDNPSELAVMGRRARQMAEELFNDRTTAAEIANVLRCVL